MSVATTRVKAPSIGGTSATRVPLPILLVVALGAALALPSALGQVDRREDALLIGFTLGSAVLVLNRAVWALAPILIGELTIASYFVTDLGMSLRLAAALAAIGSVALLVLRSSTRSDPPFRRVFLPAIWLIVFATAVNTIFSSSDYMIKYLRYQVVQLLALMVAAAVIANRRDLRRMIVVVLTVTVNSALIALWQHMNRTGAIYSDVVSIWKGRSIGIGASPVLLANQMTFALGPLLGVLAVGRWRLDRWRALLIAALGILFAGLYLTYTRSGLLALGPGIIAIGLCMRGRRRAVVLGFVVAAVVAFQLLQGTGLIGARYYRSAADDNSAASHEALFDVALKIALSNPILGIGHEHFEEVSAAYLGETPVSNGDAAIGQERPHNDFLTVWLSWGIGALAAYLALFIGTVRNFLRAARSTDPLIRSVAIGCIGGIATYATNSAFHNYLDSSSLLWLYAGVSVAMARMVTEARSGK